MTAFHYACMRGNTRIVDIIIDNAEMYHIDLTAKDRKGRNGAKIAEYYKRDNVVNLIREKMPGLLIDSMHQRLRIYLSWNPWLKAITSQDRQLSRFGQNWAD